MITTDNMYELHPPGTRIGFVHTPEVWERDKEPWTEEYTVCEDGLWRNEFGMVPAGQVTPPPEQPRHCTGCRCGEQGPPVGRMRHGG